MSIFAKVFDEFVERKFSDYLLEIIFSTQHGYMPGESTVTNLLEFSEFMVDKLNISKQIDCVYTDLSSAFNSMNFNMLFYKLTKYGVCDTLVEWFRSYLSDRQIFVKYNNFISYALVPESGVVQGKYRTFNF